VPKEAGKAKKKTFWLLFLAAGEMDLCFIRLLCVRRPQVCAFLLNEA